VVGGESESTRDFFPCPQRGGTNAASVDWKEWGKGASLPKGGGVLRCIPRERVLKGGGGGKHPTQETNHHVLEWDCSQKISHLSA